MGVVRPGTVEAGRGFFAGAGSGGLGHAAQFVLAPGLDPSGGGGEHSRQREGHAQGHALQTAGGVALEAVEVIEAEEQAFHGGALAVEVLERILFGLDMPVSTEAYRCYRLLETRDEHFDYPDYIECFGVCSRGRLCGLGLPDKVLRKVYYRNAQRVIPGVGSSHHG
ncbi:MAG: hypothetical protein NTW86_30870 [Candidatus Sumerlaeota bacterium]|nr:hypothetical protein [Candidatus Sumerlaeota bacterium]